MCDKVILENGRTLNSVLDSRKNQKMCDKAVDSYLLTLKFVPHWFVTSKMIEKLDSVVFSNDDIIWYCDIV